MIITKEAMGLASMNPMVGPNNNSGSYLVNTMSKDKDLSDGWSPYYITKTMDKFIGVDKNKKLNVRNKNELMNTVVEIYKITTDDNDDKYMKLIEELEKPYNRRYDLKEDFLYEFYTDNELITPDQLRYDPLLEKVELDKISKVVSGEADNIKQQFEKMNKTKKISNYNPEDNFHIGVNTASGGNTPLLASALMGDDE